MTVQKQEKGKKIRSGRIRKTGEKRRWEALSGVERGPCSRGENNGKGSLSSVLRSAGWCDGLYDRGSRTGKSLEIRNERGMESHRGGREKRRNVRSAPAGEEGRRDFPSVQSGTGQDFSFCRKKLNREASVKVFIPSNPEEKVMSGGQ